MLKNLWKFAVIAVLLGMLLVLAPSPLVDYDAYAEVIELPLRGKTPEVDFSKYISADEYEDPTLHVQIFRGRIYDTDYIYALVKIASPLQLRSAFVDRADSTATAKGFRIARENNAVFAINGDYFSSEYHDDNYIVRQGKVFKGAFVDEKWDLLIIDQNGDFHVLVAPTKKALNAWKDEHADLQIINTFNFGPVLINEGETAMADFNESLNHRWIGNHKPQQRMAICQLNEPLTYLFVTCEGPENEPGSGLTMNQFEECVREVEGQLPDGLSVRIAFNLDGGNSATMVFKDPEKDAVKKINAPNNVTEERWIKDIIYVVSAWKDD